MTLTTKVKGKVKENAQKKVFEKALIEIHASRKNNKGMSMVSFSKIELKSRLQYFFKRQR